MHAEPLVVETSELELHPELMAALRPTPGVQPKDLHVENWRPTLLRRCAQLLTRKAR